MVKAVLDFCKRVITSRFGQFLAVAHLVIVIYIFAQMTSHSDVPCRAESFSPGWSTIAGRSFHWTYEPLLTVVYLLDLPATIIGGILTTLFLPLSWCDYTMSWVSAILMLIFASFQWQLFGY